MLTSRYSLLPYDPTTRYDPPAGRPLNRVYQPRITVARFILLHPKHIFSFLNPLNLRLPANTECQLSDTKLLGAGAADPARPK